MARGQGARVQLQPYVQLSTLIQPYVLLRSTIYVLSLTNAILYRHRAQPQARHIR